MTQKLLRSDLLVRLSTTLFMPHLVPAMNLADRPRSPGVRIRVSAKPPEKKVYEYTERQVANRHRDKAKRLQKFAPKMSDLRASFRKDLKAKDPMKRLVALAVGIMTHTYERVGNVDSADADGHYGVVVWEVRHIKFKGDHADIRYTGKSGVKQVKTVDDAGLVAALKAATKGKDPTERVFCDGDDCVVSASDVNDYLEPYGITAKDIRGLGANDEVRKALKKIRSEGPELPRARKEKDKILDAEFKIVLDEVAKIVGHEPATLRSHYLAPTIEESYLHDGSVPERLDKKAGATVLVGGDDESKTWVQGFFRRHSKLARYSKVKVNRVFGVSGSSSHPEASVELDVIHLYPKFWDLSSDAKDFVFAHEIGHAVIGLVELVDAAEVVGGVDLWGDHEPLPFGQHNMGEAFADSFASYFIDGDVQRRYPAWARLVEYALATVKTATLDESEKDDREDERLIRQSPKKKPPRTDLHRERTRDSDTTSSDPDKDQDQKDKSQNYKDAASRVVQRYLVARLIRRYAIVSIKAASPKNEFLKIHGDTVVKNPDTGEDVTLKTLSGKSPKDSPRGYQVYMDAFDKWEKAEKSESASKPKPKLTKEEAEAIVEKVRKSEITEEEEEALLAYMDAFDKEKAEKSKSAPASKPKPVKTEPPPAPVKTKPPPVKTEPEPAPVETKPPPVETKPPPVKTKPPPVEAELTREEQKAQNKKTQEEQKAQNKKTQEVLGQHKFKSSKSIGDVRGVVRDMDPDSREIFNTDLAALSAKLSEEVTAAAEDPTLEKKLRKEAEKALAYFKALKNSDSDPKPKEAARYTAALMKAHLFEDPSTRFGLSGESQEPLVPTADRNNLPKEEKAMLERMHHQTRFVFLNSGSSKVSDEDAKDQIEALEEALTTLPENSPAHRLTGVTIHALKVYRASISDADNQNGKGKGKELGMSPVLTNAIRAAAKTGDIDWFLDTTSENARDEAHAADQFSVKLREIYNKLTDTELLEFIPSEHPLKKLAEDTFLNRHAPAARKFVRDEILSVMQAQQKFHTDDPEAASSMKQSSDEVEDNVEAAIGGNKKWFNVKGIRDSIKSIVADFLARMAKLFAKAKKSEDKAKKSEDKILPGGLGRTASSAHGTFYQRPRPDTQQRRLSFYKESLLTAANAFSTTNEDFDMLTRQGARRMTSMLDRLASAIQENPSILGINRKIAKDFAYRCDLLSDAIEGRAVANFPRQAAEADSDESDDESPKAEEAKKANLRTRMARLRRLAAESEDESEDEADEAVVKKANLRTRMARLRRLAAESEDESEDEADEAVAKKANRRQAQFDASTLGEEDMGPLEQIDSDEPWMDDHFTQSEFSEVHNMAKSARRNHHGFRLTST